MNPTPAPASPSRTARARSELLPHSAPIALRPAEQPDAATWVRERIKSPYTHPAPLRILYAGKQLVIPITGGAFPLPSNDGDVCVGAYQFRHQGEFFQLPRPAGGIAWTAALTIPHFERGSIATATFTADRTPRLNVIINPKSKKTMESAVHELLARRRPLKIRGTLRIDAIEHPLPSCKGQGSSSGDAAVAVMAAAAALGLYVSDIATQQIVQAAEGASDPLCLIRHGTSVVYRTRAGIIHKTIPCALPRMFFIGFHFTRGIKLSTGSQAEQTLYTPADVEAATPVYTRALKALRIGDASMLLSASNRSLHLNQKIRRTVMLGELDNIAKENGGFTVGSHSGDALAIGFDPANSEGLPTRFATTVRELHELGAEDVHYFATPGQF